MIHRLAAGLIVGAGCLLLTADTRGQQPTPPPDVVKPAEPKDLEPPPKPPDMGPTPLPPIETNDPTQPSDRLRQILGQGKAANGAPARLPLIAIKGRVIVKDKPPAMLVDVGGQLQLISKGSVLPGPNNTTLHVTDLTRSAVTIQVMPQNETIVLH